MIVDSYMVRYTVILLWVYHPLYYTRTILGYFNSFFLNSDWVYLLIVYLLIGPTWKDYVRPEILSPSSHTRRHGLFLIV